MDPPHSLQGDENTFWNILHPNKTSIPMAAEWTAGTTLLQLMHTIRRQYRWQDNLVYPKGWVTSITRAKSIHLIHDKLRTKPWHDNVTEEKFVILLSGDSGGPWVCPKPRCTMWGSSWTSFFKIEWHLSSRVSNVYTCVLPDLQTV